MPLGLEKVGLFFKFELLFSILAFIIAVVIWLGLLSKIDFGLLYPLISLSYVFGLLAAKFVFHEAMSVNQVDWCRIIFIGVFLVTRNP